MVHLELTADELVVLDQMVESCITDLRSEIIKADNHDYKDMLKTRKAVLLKLLITIRQSEQEPILIKAI